MTPNARQQRPTIYVPEQLPPAVAAYVARDDVEVEVSTQFRTTIAKISRTRHGQAEFWTLRVSWDFFEDAEHYDGDGWEQLTRSIDELLAKAGLERGA